MKRIQNLLLNPWVVMTLAGLAYVIKWQAKMRIGNWVHSPALIADGYHNLADLIEVGIVLLFGVYLGNLPKSEKYPMGRKRIESLIVLGIVVALAIVGFKTLIESLSGLLSLFPEAEAVARLYLPEVLLPRIKKPVITGDAFFYILISTGLCSFLSLLVSWYEIKAGEKARMSSVVADGKETAIDGLIEIATFTGFLIKFLLIYFLAKKYPVVIPKLGLIIEYLLGLGVAAVILKAVSDMFNDAWNVLMACSIGKSKVEAIKKIVLQTQGVKKVESITTFSDGTTATCLLTINSPSNDNWQRAIRRVLEERIASYLKSLGEYPWSEVYVTFKPPTPQFTREAQAIVIDGDYEKLADCLKDSTHLRIFDSNGDGKKNRATDKPIIKLSLEEIVYKLLEKGVTLVEVFKGTDEERRALEAVGIAYKQARLLRIHSSLRMQGTL